MATTTLLNAVSANTTGSGQSITGDFEAPVPASVNLAGGEIVLQAADSDTPARPSMAAANDDIVLETSSDGGDNWTLTNSAKGK